MTTASAIEILGVRVRHGVERVGDASHFVADVVRAFGERRTWLPEFTVQARRLGVDSTPSRSSAPRACSRAR